MNPEQESFPGKVINLRYDYGLQQQFLREWEYKSVVHDEWEFLRRRPFLEELDCDIKLMSSIFPFCIYNDGNFLSSLQTALSFLLVSYLMHFKEMVGTERLRSHLNVIIWDGLLSQVNIRKWVQAGTFPAATSALGWPSPRTQGHMLCGQQVQASVSRKKPFRWCGNCMRHFRLQWSSSFVTLQALGKKLPDSLHSLGGGSLFLWIHEVCMFLRANHWEVHLVFLN